MLLLRMNNAKKKKKVSHLYSSNINMWTHRPKFSWLRELRSQSDISTNNLWKHRVFQRDMAQNSLTWVNVIVQMLNCVWLFAAPWTATCQASLSPRVCSNSCPLSQWCHQTISSSVIPFSSCLQSFPASGSFPINRLFSSDDQSIAASS